MTKSKESHPFISICIPAYKRVQFLKRLLDSIQSQSFTNFEVVVTDDSPGDEVAEMCNQYLRKFSLAYYKNNSPLGTPENWNQAIRMAKGQWIKLMHDDDWFSSNESLHEYAKAIEQHQKVDFFFSAYKSVNETTGEIKKLNAPVARLRQVSENHRSTQRNPL